MSGIELKRCRFCGGEARLYEGSIPSFRIGCIKCDIQTSLFNDQEKCVEAWNRRVES